VLACLRINRGVTAPTARLTADRPGSAVVGRDLHPLGSKRNFVKSPHDSLLSDRHCLVATRKLSPRLTVRVGDMVKDYVEHVTYHLRFLYDKRSRLGKPLPAHS
jgi:hypothetical protein